MSYLYPHLFATVPFSGEVVPGSRVLAYKSKNDSQGLPVIVFARPDGKRVVIAANITDQPRQATVQLGKKFLNQLLPPHSFHTWREK
ncbi:MAG: glycoside hydrolase family 30 beta sandwich domain-containing protein [Prevotella sp.]|nr:glycoside hydrolase family 30 beta sandwich domain-containing protein [Prevotella sp.]